MSMFGSRVRIRFAVTAFCVLAVSQVLAQDIEDVQQLIEAKDRWFELAKAKQRINLDGRFSGRAGNLIRLQKCELAFLARDGVVVPRMKTGTNMEVVGYLEQQDSQMVFVVLRLSESSPDVDLVKSKRNRLPENKHTEWYALSAWAARKAAFYDDAELLTLSRELIEQGFRIERTNIGRDATRLRALADRAKELQLDEALRNELIHQSLRWEWQKLSANKPLTDKQRTAFLGKVAKELKGAKQPIRLDNKRLRSDYRFKPERTYADAKLSDRILLHRYFYREVLLPMVVATLRPDGSNGDEVASRLRKEIPEESELADDYESQELSFRVRNSNSLTRSEMLDLVDQLERTNQRKLATETKEKWVRASAARLAKRGPAGLVQAANEYDALLGDRKTAVELLKKAWNESSEKAEIEQRLEVYGVYRREKRWMSKEQVEALPQNQIDQALRDARVIPGMNMEQVRKTLGQPDRISRMVTRSQTQIAWSFLDASSNRVVVLFRRRRLSGQQETKVISVSTQPAK